MRFVFKLVVWLELLLVAALTARAGEYGSWKCVYGDATKGIDVRYLPEGKGYLARWAWQFRNRMGEEVYIRFSWISDDGKIRYYGLESKPGRFADWGDGDKRDPDVHIVSVTKDQLAQQNGPLGVARETPLAIGRFTPSTGLPVTALRSQR